MSPPITVIVQVVFRISDCRGVALDDLAADPDRNSANLPVGLDLCNAKELR
jgi:hypothetical protein